MRKLVLATANRNKIKELKELLAGLPLQILTLDDYPGLVLPVEDRDSFAGNAAVKAEAVCRATGEMALADDSGLEVDALGGRPGVYSSRYAGPGGDYKANNCLLLAELAGIPPDQRKARFRCVVAIAIPGKRTELLEGSCEGFIAEALAGEGGFGYDPLFVHPPSGSTFAEMSGFQKNKVSHRGRALHRTRSYLENILKDRSN